MVISMWRIRELTMGKYIDIYCRGRGCLLVSMCLRYSEDKEPTYTDEPFRVTDGKLTCEKFIDNGRTGKTTERENETGQATGQSQTAIRGQEGD